MEEFPLHTILFQVDTRTVQLARSMRVIVAGFGVKATPAAFCSLYGGADDSKLFPTHLDCGGGRYGIVDSKQIHPMRSPLLHPHYPSSLYTR